MAKNRIKIIIIIVSLILMLVCSIWAISTYIQNSEINNNYHYWENRIPNNYEETLEKEKAINEFNEQKESHLLRNIVYIGGILAIVSGIIFLINVFSMVRIKSKQDEKIKQTYGEIHSDNSRVCPNCSRSIPVDARICPYCKTDFEQPIQNINEKKGKINSSIVAGIISIIILLIEIYGFVVVIFYGMGGFGFGDIIVLIVTLYIINKTILKKQKLTTWEWVGFSIFVVYYCIILVYGFLIGFMQGYSSAF